MRRGWRWHPHTDTNPHTLTTGRGGEDKEQGVCARVFILIRADNEVGTCLLGAERVRANAWSVCYGPRSTCARCARAPPIPRGATWTRRLSACHPKTPDWGKTQVKSSQVNHFLFEKRDVRVKSNKHENTEVRTTLY